MDKYLLILDVGTTNIKAVLYNRAGELAAKSFRKTRYIAENTNHLEMDPIVLMESCKKVIYTLFDENQLKAEDIVSMGITSQRGAFLFWDKNTGKPCSRIISWMDKRADSYAAKMTANPQLKFLRLIARGLSFFIKHPALILLSFLKFNSLYASVRTGFFLENNRAFLDKVSDPATSILWGTLDSWILWNLTDNRLHLTDYSAASSTGLLDPFSAQWSKPILKMFKIPEHILPTIQETGADFGETSLFGGGKISITTLFADQQASLFGQGCFSQGNIKCTNGSGSFIDINTGDRPYASKRNYYPMIAWKYGGETRYMLEGLSRNTGNTIEWLINGLKLIGSPAETATMAYRVDSSEGVYFLPPRAPGVTGTTWDSSSSGNIFGLSLKTRKEHIIRAVLEGICFKIKEIVDGMQKDTKIKIKKINLDGGVSDNHFLLQFLSDILGVSIEHFKDTEATSRGAAYLTGLMSGYWHSLDDFVRMRGPSAVYTPKIDKHTRESKYRKWRNAIKHSFEYKQK